MYLVYRDGIPLVSRIHVMRIASGVPTLHALQGRKKEMKRSKVASVTVANMLELKHFCLPYTIPETLEQLRLPHVVATPPQIEGGGTADDGHDNETDAAPPLPAGMPNAFTAAALPQSLHNNKGLLYIPMDNLAFAVEGALFTGRMQMAWLSQLMDMPSKFVLHTDGKHKLHHGGWVLMTLGTHHLRWDQHNATLSTQFVPLLYLFCKQHESDGACLMLTKGCKMLASKYFADKGELSPGATMSDHSSGFRNAFEETFPQAPFGQCYPHIARKYGEAEYCKKNWCHFDEVQVHIREIHLGKSAGMRDVLTAGFGELWDSWGNQMDVFWNSYVCGGWDNWSIGLFECRLCTPSQQAQESWHKLLLQTRIPGMFKGSTEHVSPLLALTRTDRMGPHPSPHGTPPRGRGRSSRRHCHSSS